MKNLFSGDTTFARIMNTLAGVLWTGMLWLLCVLPVLTVPAASMAAYHTITHAVRRDESYVTRTFFHSFGHYFRKWIGVSVLEAFLLVWLLFDCIYLYGYGTEFSQVLGYIIYGFLLLFIAVNGILFPCASRFGGTRFTVFKLAFYITFRHLWASAALLLLGMLSVYALFLMPVFFLPVPGLYWFLASCVMEPVLKKYTADPVEEVPEEDEIVETRMSRLIVRKRKKTGGSDSRKEEAAHPDRVIRK